MIAINFFKRQAEHFLESLHNGKPIEPMGKWDTDKVLSLAGACLYAVAKHGPKDDLLRKSKGIETHRNPEQQEARVLDHHRELDAALHLYHDLAAAVDLGQYDRQFEQEVGAILELKDAKIQMRPVLGFKNPGGFQEGGMQQDG